MYDQWSKWLLGVLILVSVGMCQLPNGIPDEAHLIKKLAGYPFQIIKHDTIISKNSVVKNSIVVKNATLHIGGTVKGNIVALNGDVFVDSTAVVTGNITAVNGWVTLQPGAQVSGIIRETTWETVVQPSEPDEELAFYFPQPEIAFPEHSRYRSFRLRYNRVEGLFLGFQNIGGYPHRRPLQLLWQVGYGFSSKKGQFLLGVQRQFDLSSFLSWKIGGQWYRQTAVRDNWRLSELENTITAFFFNEDYLDYFWKEGGSFFTVLTIRPYLWVRAEYVEEQHQELPVVTDWAVWGKTKQFRPALVLGDYARFYRLLRLQVIWQTKNKSWQGDALPVARLQFWWEAAPRNWMGNWAYQRIEVEMVLNVPLSRIDRLRLRLRGGSAYGELPPQRLFLLGGFSTLRAYAFNEFQGNRYLLANVEYQVINNVVDDLLFGLDTDLVIFLDSGAAWRVAKEKPWWRLEWENAPWVSNIGIGLGSARDGLRINFSRPLTQQGRTLDNLKITVRIQKTF